MRRWETHEIVSCESKTWTHLSPPPSIIMTPGRENFNNRILKWLLSCSTICNWPSLRQARCGDASLHATVEHNTSAISRRPCRKVLQDCWHIWQRNIKWRFSQRRWLLYTLYRTAILYTEPSGKLIRHWFSRKVPFIDPLGAGSTPHNNQTILSPGKHFNRKFLKSPIVRIS